MEGGGTVPVCVLELPFALDRGERLTGLLPSEHPLVFPW